MGPWDKHLETQTPLRSALALALEPECSLDFFICQVGRILRLNLGNLEEKKKTPTGTLVKVDNVEESDFNYHYFVLYPLGQTLCSLHPTIQLRSLLLEGPASLTPFRGSTC